MNIGIIFSMLFKSDLLTEHSNKSPARTGNPTLRHGLPKGVETGSGSGVNLRLIIVVGRRTRQIPLNLARLPNPQAHSNVKDHEDAHGENEEEERAELVNRIIPRVNIFI